MVEMHVTMYTVSGLYGFCESPEVYFHAGVFEAGHWPGIETAPPPILGERVSVDYAENRNPTKAPRANRVIRLDPPILVSGVVETFNPKTGWGFIQGKDGVSYYLHRSEVDGNRLPLPGMALQFYAGTKRGKARACYILYSPQGASIQNTTATLQRFLA